MRPPFNIVLPYYPNKPFYFILSIWKGKTDKLDAVKITNYYLDCRYTPADQVQQTLKTCRH